MNTKKLDSSLPRVIEGGWASDERGVVSFVNAFNFPKIKRFYLVSNRKRGEVRAWHGHKNEIKYVFVVSGRALIGAVPVDNWKKPSKETKVYRFLLSSETPSILYIPKGYANGFKSLTSNAKLMFFSTKTLGESKKDDIRYDAGYWDIWD